MKPILTIVADRENVGDIQDMKTIETAHGRAHNWIELPNPIAGFYKNPGTFITREHIATAVRSFNFARRKYAEFAGFIPGSYSFCPPDEAKAIVQAIDDALAVLERWQGEFI